MAFSQAPPWRVVRCPDCGLVYRNPMERRDAVLATYATEQPGGDVLRALHESQRRAHSRLARRLFRRLPRHGSGLEVGSYAGAFLAAAREHGWQFEGLDVNPAVNAFVRSLGFVAHDADLEHFRSDRTFDAVAIWNTFDQLPDPRAALFSARRLLRPGGLLALRVPNGECYAHWRRRLVAPQPVRAMAVGVLARNNLLTFPYRFGFSPGAMKRLLGSCGFATERVARGVSMPTSDEYTKAWAAAAEGFLKPLTRIWTPWFEVYARPE